MTTRTSFAAVAWLSIVAAGLICATMADGRSLCVLKRSERASTLGLFPPLTSSIWTDYAAFGLLKDYKGNFPHDPEHGMNSDNREGCNEKQKLAESTAAFVFISMFFTVFSIIAAFLGTATGKGIFGTISLGTNGAGIIFMIITFAQAAAIFNKKFCGVTLTDTYNMSYAIPFVVLAMILSITNILIIVLTGATKDDVPPAQGQQNHEPTAETVPAPKEAAN
eukprot:TRINITY_DN1927_c1_g1_i1.p1 TRINITY_DN1927_c1_g1~~TRINITY_DN1927_c1_g1_i1.p1  ORF type:complete len:222 (+),score=101.57 TRINITY_DN1927_c1_g1_i1:63-728(+)